MDLDKSEYSRGFLPPTDNTSHQPRRISVDAGTTPSYHPKPPVPPGCIVSSDGAAVVFDT